MRLRLGCSLVTLTAVACGMCFDRVIHTQVDAEVAASRGLTFDSNGLPAAQVAAIRYLSLREYGMKDLAADGTPVCAKLCPPGAPLGYCLVTRPDGGALSVVCAEHPLCD
jgi:hypothetical protein